MIVLAGLLSLLTTGCSARLTWLPADAAQVHSWAERVFNTPTIDSWNLRLIRQDYGTLRLGRSVMDTQLRLGNFVYSHGLGTHANSEIEMGLPEKAEWFDAICGIDNNYDTQGQRGAVTFIVEADGKEIFHSPVLKGSDRGLPIHVGIPRGSSKLTLKVKMTDAGPGYDQADWVDAKVSCTNGQSGYLDSQGSVIPFRSDHPPFSFTYSGVAVDLSKWKHKSTSTGPDLFNKGLTSDWTDPHTGLVIHAQARLFYRAPAVDWVLTFENTGKADTPLIENVQAVDTEFNLGGRDVVPVFHRLAGDETGPGNFRPIDLPLPLGTSEKMAPVGGRSSNNTGFPFFDIGNASQGVLAAIGWTGQWAAQVTRQDDNSVRLQAGMERTHFILHPGEKVRGPRILLMTWDGDREAALNRWRQLLLAQYVPQSYGRPIEAPISLQCFDRYWQSDPEWATEAGQIDAAHAAAKLGFDTLWFDAAWFPGGFPDGVGNWTTRPKEFPNGLKPISDACHAGGVNFMLWFEPERVGAGTQIAREHPDWVFGGGRDGLFRLDLPEAREWLTKLISQRITEYGLDIYRQDFNMDPLADWRKNDAPDRQGITEMNYVEGLYKMWDQLRAEHPGLRIDNCSSGGRRIDLETISRALPLWRTDYGCSPGGECDATAQTMSLCRYVPLNATSSWSPNAFEMRSAATAGLAVEFDYRNKDFPWEEGKAAIAEIKENQKYWYGDFYPLTSYNEEKDQFLAYQLDRPDLKAGIILAFRREKCPTPGIIAVPHGIDPTRRYAVDFIDEDRVKTSITLSGKEMIEDGLTLRIRRPRASLLVRYRVVQ